MTVVFLRFEHEAYVVGQSIGSVNVLCRQVRERKIDGRLQIDDRVTRLAGSVKSKKNSSRSNVSQSRL
jgi:hypothetical protein